MHVNPVDDVGHDEEDDGRAPYIVNRNRQDKRCRQAERPERRPSWKREPVFQVVDLQTARVGGNVIVPQYQRPILRRQFAPLCHVRLGLVDGFRGNHRAGKLVPERVLQVRRGDRCGRRSRRRIGHGQDTLALRALRPLPGIAVLGTKSPSAWALDGNAHSRSSFLSGGSAFVASSAIPTSHGWGTASTGPLRWGPRRPGMVTVHGAAQAVFSA